MAILIKEINGKDTIWYSESYVKDQIEQAFKSGMFEGCKIEFHSITPLSEESFNKTLNEFKEKLRAEYNEALHKNIVIINP